MAETMEQRYEDLSGVGKHLIDLLYGSKQSYLTKRGHVLEDYIIAFDQNMDDNSATRAIAGRIGIEIPRGEIAHEYFYDRLVEHITNHEQNVTKRENSLSTKQVINMTEQEYNKKYNGNYYDRLSQIRHL